MRSALKVHSASRPGLVTGIEADIRRPAPGTLQLAFHLAGPTGRLRIPAPAAPERMDGLWRHTCFEAFVGLEDGQGYLEFNLSPSGQWAAYRFTGYRAGMAPLEPLLAPDMEVTRTENALTLEARLELTGVPGLGAPAPWRLGLSAVVEDEDGDIAYWALAHGAGKPDFHDAAGFACLLPAPEGS